MGRAKRKTRHPVWWFRLAQPHPCASWLKSQVAEAIAGEGFRVFELPSGAGHGGMAMIDIAMLRCCSCDAAAASAVTRTSMSSKPMSTPVRACCCG
jgi:hypothetical protein